MTAKVEKGGENVFEDIGLEVDPTDLIKMALAMELSYAIKVKGLTKTEAAKILNTHSPDLSNLTNGKVSKFSFDRIFSYLNGMGIDVVVSLRETFSEEKGKISVSV